MLKKRYRHVARHYPLRKGVDGQLLPPHINMYENVPKSEGYNNRKYSTPFELYRKPFQPNQWPNTGTTLQNPWQQETSNLGPSKWKQESLKSSPNQWQQQNPLPKKHQNESNLSLAQWQQQGALNQWQQDAHLTANKWQQGSTPWQQQGLTQPPNQWFESQPNPWEMDGIFQPSNDWSQMDQAPQNNNWSQMEQAPQNNNWSQMNPMSQQAMNPNQSGAFPRPHMFTNPFQNENGQLDVNKTLATVGQFATTIQQISPIIKQFNNLIKALR